MSAADPAGAERLEALLAGEEPRTPAEERRALLLAELRGGAPVAAAALHARVLARADAPARSRRRPLPGGRARILALAAAVVAVALAAAAVHGVVSPGPGLRPVASSARTTAPAPAATAGIAAATQPAAPSRASRSFHSAVGFLALEGVAGAAALALAAVLLVLVRERRRREERRLLGASAAGRRGDLME